MKDYSIAQLETLLKIVIESPRETVEESVIKTFWIKELSKEIADKRWDKVTKSEIEGPEVKRESLNEYDKL